jgi:hypothetical protein
MRIFEIDDSLIDATIKHQIAAMQEAPHRIRNIQNPSEEVQLAAVNKNGLTLNYIKNPTDAVRLAAIKQTASAIVYINNPTEEEQIAALQKDGSLLFHIKHPSPNALQICKRSILRSVLEAVKEGFMTSMYDPTIEKLKNTGWPELAIIKKSLDSFIQR